MKILLDMPNALCYTDGMKKRNSYQEAISSKLYEETPKAVFAAIAVSLLANLSGVEFEKIDAAILDEWRTLNANGIVPQAAPK